MNKKLLAPIVVLFGIMPAIAQQVSSQKQSTEADKVESAVTVSVPANQSIQKLADIKKIFVAPLGTDEGAELIRQKIITHLMQTTPIIVVETADDADATLAGVAELNGHLVMFRGSGRTRYSPELLVRLTGKNKKLLWSDDVTIPKFFASGNASKITTDVAIKLVKELTVAMGLE